MSKAKSHSVDGSYRRDKNKPFRMTPCACSCQHRLDKGDFFLESMKMGMAGTSKNEVLENKNIGEVYWKSGDSHY